jgi:hypothetical protein
MRIKKNLAIFIAVCFLAGSFLVQPAFGDDDDDHFEHRSEHHSEHRERGLTSTANPVYAEQCGTCHLAYPPGLLPAASWEKILSNLPGHNGEEVVIEPASKETIAGYLAANAADKSVWKRSRKILRSLRGAAPVRITEVPYIRHKHHEIPAAIFQRESVGSFSNCSACHKTAEQGVFDDDSVKIPE